VIADKDDDVEELQSSANADRKAGVEVRWSFVNVDGGESDGSIYNAPTE
jgi:hypothetical protein